MSLGFILLRHVTSVETNELWMECYDCIRKHYPLNKILIIDDSSNYTFVDTNKILSNTLIIQSEFKGRGELLPYYYYFHNKLFDYAVVLHDSVFIQQYIEFGKENRFLWSFEHRWDDLYDYSAIFQTLTENELVKKIFYDKSSWEGCFGVMSVLSHTLLCEMEKNFNILQLTDCITTRHNRMALERIFAVLFTLSNKMNNIKTTSVFGNIHIYSNNYGGFGMESYNSYKIKKDANNINTNLPIIKVWSGR